MSVALKKRVLDFIRDTKDRGCSLQEIYMGLQCEDTPMYWAVDSLLTRRLIHGLSPVCEENPDFHDQYWYVGDDMDRLSYRKAVEVIEAWNVLSGLRRYCTTVCGGECCDGCKSRHCMGGEGGVAERTPTCGVFICRGLLGKLPMADRAKMDCVNSHVLGEWHRHNEPGMFYYQSPTLAFMRNARFSPRVLGLLKDINFRNVGV